MNKMVLMLGVGLLSVMASISEGAAPEQQNSGKLQYEEKFEFSLPKDLAPADWKMVHRYAPDAGTFVIEYIPSNQTLSNWSEMVTLQYFSYRFLKSDSKPVHQWVNRIKDSLEKEYGNVNWKVLDKTSNSMTVEWKFPFGLGGNPPEYDIMKFVTTDKGLHQISYASKVKNLDPERRQKWVDFIINAQVVNK